MGTASAYRTPVGVLAPQSPEARGDPEMLRARLDVAERVGELLAHELGNVLIVLRTHSDLLAHQWDRLPEDQRRRSAETMDEQAEHLDELLVTLLDLARQKERSYRRIHLESFLRRCIERADPAAFDGRGAGTKVALSCPLGAEVTSDPGLLDIAVRNLIDNALRHGCPPVLVTAEVADGCYRVRVDDAGPGVSEAFAPRLFGRFQCDETTVPGMGLGLSIVRDLLRLDHGSISFIPRPGGASFVIELPDHPEAVATAGELLAEGGASVGCDLTPAGDPVLVPGCDDDRDGRRGSLAGRAPGPNS